MSVAGNGSSGAGGGKGPKGCTQGHLLGGRVHYMQPRQGYRSGIEAVLLAASLPARPGERVLEGGSGAGATLLCLAARVPGISGTGIERDAALAGLARTNALANNLPELTFAAGDIASLPLRGSFDHACANPPYHPADGTASPDASRRQAKQANDGLLAAWARALAHQLRTGGTLTFIVPAGSLPNALAAYAAGGCQPTAMLPLWPKSRRPAKLLLLRGIKDAKSPFRVLPGMVLHQDNGAFTDAADSILRDGQALPLSG